MIKILIMMRIIGTVIVIVMITVIVIVIRATILF